MKAGNKMFICQACGKNSKPSEKQYSQIIDTRKKYYENGSVGWEIVREIKVCESCMEKCCLARE